MTDARDDLVAEIEKLTDQQKLMLNSNAHAISAAITPLMVDAFDSGVSVPLALRSMMATLGSCVAGITHAEEQNTETPLIDDVVKQCAAVFDIYAHKVYEDIKPFVAMAVSANHQGTEH